MHVGTKRFRECKFTLFQRTVSCTAGSWEKGSKQFAFISCQSTHWSLTSCLWVAVRQKWNSWCEFSAALWASVRELLLNKGLAMVPPRLNHTGVTGSRSFILSFTCSHHSSFHELCARCIHEHRQPLKNNLIGLISTAWPQHVSAHPRSQLYQNVMILTNHMQFSVCRSTWGSSTLILARNTYTGWPGKMSGKTLILPKNLRVLERAGMAQQSGSW